MSKSIYYDVLSLTFNCIFFDELSFLEQKMYTAKYSLQIPNFRLFGMSLKII